MNAEIVGVGTELLLGQIANTNARWMSEHLAAIGVDVLHHQVVGDNLDRIVEALGNAAGRADVVLVTGGLGPTEDDITRDALAELLGVELEFHPEIESMLRARFASIGSDAMPENNLRQAGVPKGARYVMPLRGTAPGIVAELGDGTRVYAMAGVPLEMVEVMEGTVLPELAAAAGPSTLVSTVLRCTGIGESRVAEVLADLFEASSNPSVAYLATGGEVKVRVSAKAATRPRADALIAPLADEVLRRLGDVVFSKTDESLAEAVGRLLRSSRRTLCFAESLTGGGLGARITSVPGSSEYFAGSAVVYTAEAKERILGVSHETIASSGVVSEACAREMAARARKAFGSDVALAVTGSAGPDRHGNAEPGTVWLALDAGDLTHARLLRAPGERDRVRRWTEQAGLDLVRRYLEGAALPTSDRPI